MAPPKNNVTIREVYELLENLREEIGEKDKAAWDRITDLKSAADEKHQSYEMAIAKLISEIYGEGDTKGLRGRVQDIERNITIAHGLQVALTTLGTAFAAWWGSKTN